MTDKPIAKVETGTLAETTDTSIETILQQAVQAGRTGAELKEFLDVYERMQGVKARQAFNAAMAQFKATCPPIPRLHKTDQYMRVTSDGRRVPGTYAGLQDIAGAIDATLTACGLSYRWTDTKTESGHFIVTCRVSHAEGHYEDTPSPPVPIALNPNLEAKQKISPQQKAGLASTYAYRYSLIAALGLSSVDEDDDGRGNEPVETITEDQALQLEDLLNQLHDLDFIELTRTNLLKYLNVDSLSECPASRYAYVVEQLQKKIEKMEGT